MGGARIEWSKGGTATVLALLDDAITLRSSIPSPPGSRIEGALGLRDRSAQRAGRSTPDAVRVKVHSSKRQEDGSFVLEGRVLDMTRALREKLAVRSGEYGGERKDGES